MLGISILSFAATDARAQDTLCVDAVTGNPRPAQVSDAAAAAGPQIICGDGATAIGVGAVAIGTNASADGAEALAFGTGAEAENINSVAIGSEARAINTNAVAIGRETLSSGEYSIAIGSGAQATGNLGTALGNNAIARQFDVSLGAGALGGSSGSQATVAVGFGAAESATNVERSVFVGMSTGVMSTGRQNVYMGLLAGGLASGNNNIAQGSGASAVVTGDNNVAIGYQAGTLVQLDAAGNPVVINAATYSDAINIGRDTKGIADNAIAIGTEAQAGERSIAIGTGAEASGVQSISVGTGNIVSGDNSGAFGDPNSVTGSGSYVVGNDNDVAADNVFILGNGVTVAAGLDGAVALGNGTTVEAAVGTASSIIGGVGYNYAGAAPVATVSIGAAGAERTITHVAAGRISAVSTDAINGSQLFATNQQVTLNTTAIADNRADIDQNIIDIAANGASIDNLGQSVANGLGGTSSYSPATDTVTTQLSVGGNAYSNVNDALNAVNSVAGAGWNVAATGAGSTGANIGPNGTVTFAGDSNVTVTQTGADDAGAVNVALNRDLDLDSVTTGGSVLATGGLTVNDGTNSTAYGAAGMTIAGGPSVTTAGIDGGGLAITNVAAGIDDTDAVNVSQLNAATVAGTNANERAVKYDWTDSNGNGVVDPGEVDYSTATLAGPAGTTLTNVAAGDVSATSTDAVNGSQLFATNQQVTLNTTAIADNRADIDQNIINIAANGASIDNLGQSVANGLGGTSSYNPATDTVTTQLSVGGNAYSNVNDALNAVNSVAGAGWNVAATGAGSTGANIGPNGTVTFAGDSNVTVTQTGADDAGAVNVALNRDLDLDSVTTGGSVLATGGLTVNDGTNSTAYGAAGMTIAGGPSVTTAGIDGGGLAITNVAAGIDDTDAVNVSQLNAATVAGTNANERAVKYDWTDSNGNGVVDPGEVDYSTATLAGSAGTTLTNVAAGDVSATSTDAVNGSQLFATNQQVTRNGDLISAQGQSVATALGGGSTYDPVTGAVTASLTVGGNAYDNVNDAINAIGQVANAGWNIQANGGPAGNVPANGTLNVVAGSNAAVTLNGNRLEVAVVDNPTFNGMVTANGGLTVAAGQTVNMGGNVVRNVAAGQIAATSTDAVNGSQLHAVQQVASNSVQYDAGRNSVTFNPGGNAATLHNVAAGVAPTDAVNVAQLNAGLGDTLSQARQYTDDQLARVGFDLGRVHRDLRAGTAGALAAAGLPQAFEPGKGMLAFGAATYGGEQAFAIGLSRIFDDGRTIVKAGASYNTRSEAGANVGVGFQF